MTIIMNKRDIKIGIIAGEESGDQLGADLIKELRSFYKDATVTIVGVGGKALEKQGLKSIFAMSEISIIGIAEVLKKIPKLLYYIHKTSQYLLSENIDSLIIIDSPDFTHRVAKKVKKAKKNLPIIQYIAPSVWAWRSQRATKIKTYIDELLTILPFEPKLFKKLKGPKATYVGHNLINNCNIKKAYEAQNNKHRSDFIELLLLPGSRKSEVKKLATMFSATAKILKISKPKLKVTIVTLPHLENLVKNLISELPCNIITDETEKWNAFAKADIALAANGTVSLELALCNIPMILAYRLDIFANYFIKPFLKIWSAALPNIILNKAFIPEFYNEYASAIVLAKQLEYLLDSKYATQAQIHNFNELRKIMQTSVPPGKLAAIRVAQHINFYLLSTGI